jgi:hypothetical protein
MAAESRQHGAGAFRNTKGSIDWTEVALFLQRQKHRLAEWHHEFIDDMASRTVYGREPTSNNTNTCTACSSSSEGESYEPAAADQHAERA